MLNFKTLLIAAAACALIGMPAAAQQKKVTGFVFDSTTAEPLAGVSITITGTSCGVNTTLDGEYAITCSSGTIICASMHGYVTKCGPMFDSMNWQTIHFLLKPAQGARVEPKREPDRMPTVYAAVGPMRRET